MHNEKMEQNKKKVLSFPLSKAVCQPLPSKSPVEISIYIRQGGVTSLSTISSCLSHEFI